VSERLAFVEEFIKQQHSQAHDAGMQAQDTPTSVGWHRNSRMPIRSRKWSIKRTRWAWRKFSSPKGASNHGVPLDARRPAKPD